MDKFEAFALGHFLNNWSSEFSFEDVIDVLEGLGSAGANMHEDVLVWEPFENESGQDLADLICEFVEQLKYFLG